MNQNRLTITNATVIDCTGQDPIQDAVVEIDGNVITDVRVARESDRQPVRGDGPVIDAGGGYVMPGLIDGHCHLSLHQGAMRGVRYPSSPEFCTVWAARCASLALRAGVTGISVPGGKWFVDVNIRDCIDAGLLEGPRVFSAGRALTPFGGIFDSEPSWRRDPEDLAGVLCNSQADYVSEVRRQCKHGVDLIKVADSYWGDVQAIAEDEIRAVVDEAHRRNVRVAIHSRGSGSTAAAARAGVDWIFHADLATEADLDEVAEAGIPILPAFTAVSLAVNDPSLIGMDEPTRDRMKRQLEMNLRSIQMAREKGITILVGTDTGNAAAFGHGRWHWNEAEILVKEIGMSPMEALEASTRLNATVLGLEGKVGTIEPGMLADLLIWAVDPLADVTLLQDGSHLTHVIKDGAVIDRNGPLGFKQLPAEPKRAR